MDPARSEKPASDALTDAEREARIEQLLLAGLDRYFANDYEQAINLWTRVLFLDRQHDRARAYIERARSAQAERQRESEALMHQGLDAFTSGDVARARELVSNALERGASRDLALGVLDRIERLGRTTSSRKPHRTRNSWLTPSAAPEPVLPSQPGTRRRIGMGAMTLAAIGVLAVAAVALWGLTLTDVGAWFASQTRRTTPAILMPASDQLPVASATELYIARARSLFTSGRLRDALRQLDRVPIGAAGRVEADRLRADIQRELLAAAAADLRPANEVP